MKTVYLKIWLPLLVLLLTGIEIAQILIYENSQPPLFFWLNTGLLVCSAILILHYLITKPIQHLTKVIQNFSTDKTTRSKLTGGGELAVLGKSFNQLATHLADTQYHLNKQKNLYALLSATNQIIIRLTSQQQLFDDVCQNVIKQPHFILAWIGLVNEDTEAVDITAHAGTASHYVDFLYISTNPQIAEGRAPQRQRFGKTVMSLSTVFKKIV
jgi:nitrate/nitrite-specific signal transduction histidine kinase